LCERAGGDSEKKKERGSCLGGGLKKGEVQTTRTPDMRPSCGITEEGKKEKTRNGSSQKRERRQIKGKGGG